jgi:hypothetical protein
MTAAGIFTKQAANSFHIFRSVNRVPDCETSLKRLWHWCC